MYLYTATNSTDQKPGRDVVDRRETLTKELDQRIHGLDAILNSAGWPGFRSTMCA